jgi:hypothetical protein
MSSVLLEIGLYSQTLEFTVFSGLQIAGYDLVLWMPQQRLHSRHHDIDHFLIKIWIDTKDGCEYYKKDCSQ